MKSIRAIGQMMQARNYSNNRCVQHACAIATRVKHWVGPNTCVV